jgi:hypothetical protein
MKHVRRWLLIMLYMAFIYCVMLGLLHYARTHPLVDDRAIAKETAK